MKNATSSPSVHYLRGTETSFVFQPTRKSAYCVKIVVVNHEGYETASDMKWIYNNSE